jgi:hypothetical protein
VNSTITKAVELQVEALTPRNIIVKVVNAMDTLSINRNDHIVPEVLPLLKPPDNVTMTQHSVPDRVDGMEDVITR